MTQIRLRGKSKEIYDNIVYTIKKKKLRLEQSQWGVTFPEGRVERSSFSQTSKTGPVCAIGAGCLWNGPMKFYKNISPIAAFAKLHKTSLAFAAGISDGFEWTVETDELLSDNLELKQYIKGAFTNPDSIILPSEITTEDLEDNLGTVQDYKRGARVGLAISKAYYEDDE